MSDPVRYIDRRSRKKETEAIYGGGFLRWTYQTSPGRLALHALVKRAFFSRIYGWLMNRPGSRKKIGPFLSTYGVKEEELTEKAEDFGHFNAFFSRALRRGSRPVAPGDDVAVLPADGRHVVIPDLSQEVGFLVKGMRFDIATFVGDFVLADRYRLGSMLVSRLCPVDYHRFHFPCAGVPGPSRILPGPLFSVNPIALRRRPGLLWENKRWICEMESPVFGRVLLAEIGATCVGSVVPLHPAGYPARKGDEKGWFRFGGSSVAVVFEPGRITFDADLVAHSAEGWETYARMGESLGRAV
jgi:phosphatidylserine decarboxylase